LAGGSVTRLFRSKTENDEDDSSWPSRNQTSQSPPCQMPKVQAHRNG
jgi:hypothetical protein